MTLDEKVNVNSQRIEKIKNDIDLIMNNHLAHMADDIDECKADLKQLRNDVTKILTILAEK